MIRCEHFLKPSWSQTQSEQLRVRSDSTVLRKARDQAVQALHLATPFFTQLLRVNRKCHVTFLHVSPQEASCMPENKRWH